MISDTRSDNIETSVFDYGLNARGRLSTVSEEGALKASYTYDMSEQRIVKAVAGQAAIHYHYDGEGRLISETDAATGETLREYVWLGLTPIAVFDAASDEGCAEEISELEAQIADRTGRIDTNAARITELEALTVNKQSRIDTNAARVTELEGLIVDKQTRTANNAARITELEALAADKQSRITVNAARIAELEALIIDKQTRIAALNPAAQAARIAELEALIVGHEDRIVFLSGRNTELSALITTHEDRIVFLAERNTELATLITTHEERLEFLTTRNTELADLKTAHEERVVFLTERNTVLTEQRISFQQTLDTLLETGCEAAAGKLNYLHSDHLGRPKFATRADGSVSWDGGITTPFGVQVTALAAQTQALMFPGQYMDAETTGAGVSLSHNWHRTYDPTLGRYLQADPIGLAGGLNRYAYVGGNPNSYVDPTGLQSLVFDGESLTFDDGKGGPFPITWPAVSGKPQPDSCQCEADQALSDTGPIPTGQYTLNPKDSNRRRWYKRKWGPESAWGNVRTEIKPKPGTNTFGRYGFNIHGGFYPGSAGCIDLTDNNEDFHKWFKEYGKPLDLNVDYPQVPSPRIKP